MSRIAVMTGLTRKEVRRLRELLELGEVLVPKKYTPLSRVLDSWHSETDFLDHRGRPSILPFSGNGVTFSDLVRRYAGDIPPGAIRTELKRLGAILEDDEGNLQLVRRDIHPQVGHESVSLSLLHGAYAILENIAHNNDPKRKEPTWVQMTAFAGGLRNSDIARVRQICAGKAKDAIETYDEMFSGLERDQVGADVESNQVPVAMGVFYFEEHDPQLHRIWKHS